MSWVSKKWYPIKKTVVAFYSNILFYSGFIYDVFVCISDSKENIVPIMFRQPTEKPALKEQNFKPRITPYI